MIMHSSISISTLLLTTLALYYDVYGIVEAGYIYRPPSKAPVRLDYIVGTQEDEADTSTVQIEERSQKTVDPYPRRIMQDSATIRPGEEAKQIISNNNNHYRIKEMPLNTTTLGELDHSNVNDIDHRSNPPSNAELIASLAVSAAEISAAESTATATTKPSSSSSSSSSSTRIPTTATFSPLEAWCLHHLDRWYSKSQSLKCPFLRRRSGDILDNVELVVKHTVIRKECWPLMGCPQSERPAGRNRKQNQIKYKHLSLEQIQQFIIEDWKPKSNKGYYITGKLTTGIYRDDCLFTGPDPDMPIKGLRKYVGVAAHLFDFNESYSTLKSIKIVDDDGGKAIVADWQLKGILKLPWRPQLPTLEGKTIYRFDDEGLIREHEEFWDISASYAFCQTLFPNLAAKIWKTQEDDVKEDNHQEDQQKAQQQQALPVPFVTHHNHHHPGQN